LKDLKKQLQEQLRFEQLVSDLSARFIDLDARNVDRRIQDCLRLLHIFFEADTCAILKYSLDQREASIIHIAHHPKAGPYPQRIDLSQMFPYLHNSIRKGRSLILSTGDELPASATADRENYKAFNMISSLYVPLYFKKRVRYVLAMVTAFKKKKWQPAFLPRLKMLGEIIVNCLERIDTEVRLHGERKNYEMNVIRLRNELAHVMRVAAMGEMTAALAHELNQPLAAIMNNAQAAQRFLAQDRPNMNEIKEIVGDIIFDDNRAKEVIVKLRALLRKSDFEFASIAMNDLVREILPLIRSEIVIRKIDFETQLADALPFFCGDKIQLQQVILNLILNSFDALSQGSQPPSLRVSTCREGARHVALEIRDNGCGVPPKNLSRLFSPFFTTKKEGLGMGLAISKTIIGIHGGKIWAENRPEGGASFFVKLPLCSGKGSCIHSSKNKNGRPNSLSFG
jgi:signal transduction histidine kinase